MRHREALSRLLLECILAALSAFLSPEAKAETAPGLEFLSKEAYGQVPAITPALAGSLPSAVDLSPWFPPPGDQGSQASCVGWAIAAVKGYQEQFERRWGAATHSFSAAFVYNSIKAPGNCSVLTYLPKGLEQVIRAGIAPLDLFPYDPNHCEAAPSKEVLAAAKTYRAVYYRRLDRFDDARSHLAAGTPVIVGLRLNHSFTSLTAGAIYDEDPGSEAFGHAMVLAGYDDQRQAYLLANSSGPAWARNGFGWISYKSYNSSVREAYVLGDLVESYADIVPLGGSNKENTMIPELFVVSGRNEYVGNVVISAGLVVFEDGANVRIRNGATFEVRAASIVVHGRATIDGRGEPGLPGRPGERHPYAEWVSRTDRDYWNARNAVAADQSHPDRGLPGQDGGIGGRGATLIFSSRPKGGLLETLVEGGAGGAGGTGGSGRLLKNGRNFYCDGCMFNAPGRDGQSGPQGPAGAVIYLSK